MSTHNSLRVAIGLAAALALGACGTPNGPAYSSNSGSGYSQSGGSGYANQSYGVVQSIELVRQERTTGGGAIAGALVGGIVGNQIGAGDGRTAATVLGAVGGAYAGNQLEKRNQQQSEAWQITVRLRDGSYQTVTQSNPGDLRVGDRVQLDNGVVRR